MTTELKVKEWLKELEYSMGNGQCPECHGLNSRFLYNLYDAPRLGHAKDCRLGIALVYFNIPCLISERLGKL